MDIFMSNKVLIKLISNRHIETNFQQSIVLFIWFLKCFKWSLCSFLKTMFFMVNIIQTKINIFGWNTYWLVRNIYCLEPVEPFFTVMNLYKRLRWKNIKTSFCFRKAPLCHFPKIYKSALTDYRQCISK